MEKQELYSFDDTNINFNTSELDDIISSEDILKNFKEEPKDKLTLDESEVTLLKEEPLSDSMDEILTEESKDIPQPEIQEQIPDVQETVLFSDDMGKEMFKESEGQIVEDKETEAFVQQEINKTTEQYNSYQDQADSPKETTEESSFFEEDGDETISLSSDELSNILEDTEESGASLPTVDSVLQSQKEEKEIEEESLQRIEEPEELKLEEIPSIDFQTEPEVSEELTETPPLEQELEVSEIPIEEIEEPLQEDHEIKTSPMEQTEIGKEVSSFFEEEEDESIGLTVHELENILKSTEIVEEAKGETIPVEDRTEIREEQKEEEVFENLPSEIIDETTLENGLSLKEEIIPEKEIESEDSYKQAFAGIPVDLAEEKMEESIIETPPGDSENKEKLKMVLKYLDSLLDYLPEDKIKEFSESEYYDLYHSLFQDLGL